MNGPGTGLVTDLETDLEIGTGLETRGTLNKLKIPKFLTFPVKKMHKCKYFLGTKMTGSIVIVEMINTTGTIGTNVMTGGMTADMTADMTASILMTGERGMMVLQDEKDGVIVQKEDMTSTRREMTMRRAIREKSRRSQGPLLGRKKHPRCQ